MGFVSYFRFLFGSVFMFGVAPEFFGLWLAWKGISLVLPNWVYQWGDDKLYCLYQSLVVFFFETCTGTEIYLYGDTEDILKRRESVLYISNHQSTVDWIIANFVAIRGGSLGHLRYVMKDSLQLIPLYGFYFYSHGCIYVKRGQFNQGKMISSLNYLKDEKIPSWLIIFPEGTRYFPSNSKLMEKSEKYAKEHNMPILKHHLVPKIRGTWLAVQHLYDKIDAVYDISVYYEGTIDEKGVRKAAPQLKEFLLGYCPRLHIVLQRISMSEVPQTEEALQVWMQKRFEAKDKFIEQIFEAKRTGSKDLVPGIPGGRACLGLWRTLSSFLFFAGLSIPLAFTPLGRRIYLQVLFYGALAGYGWLAVRSVC